MTLIKKFDEVFIENWLSDYATECEKIAEDFAIDFAEWLLIIYNEDIIYDAYSKEQLLEIYKKENEL